MIHHVISEVDRGEPILVSRRPLFYFMMTPYLLTVIQVEEIPFIEGVDENIENLERRIHEKEHKLIVSATRIIAEKIQERKSNGVT